MKVLAELLHLLYCDKAHEGSLENFQQVLKDSNQCTWFMEEILDTCWELKAHGLWIKKSQEFCDERGLSERAARSYASSLATHVRKLNELAQAHPYARKDFIQLLRSSE